MERAMTLLAEKLKYNKVFNQLNKFVESIYFPFFVAAVILWFYYMAWDIAMIYFVAIVGIYILLFIEDVTPIVTVLLFMNIIISYQNSPSGLSGNSGYYMQTHILVQIIIVISLYVLTMFARVTVLSRGKTFKPSPVFWGLVALAAAFIFSGVGSVGYEIMDFAYGLFMAFFFLGIYTVVSTNVRLTEQNYKKICYGFFAFSIAIAIEVLVKFVTNFDEVIVNGEIVKTAMTFGWGVWNTMGMLLTISIPPIFMLAAKSKRGYLFILYATFLVLLGFIVGSRQGMIGVVMSYGISAIMVVVKSRRRLLNIVTLAAVFIIALIILIAKWEKIFQLLGRVMDGLFNPDGSFSGNGRMSLIRLAMTYFATNPIFGTGFMTDFSVSDPGFSGLSVIPLMAHCTFAELFAACGAVGVIIYCLHRTQTIIAFFKKPSFNKGYMAVVVCMLLILSLVDNHLFYIFPTMVYSSLLPFVTGREHYDRKEVGIPQE